jgi:hypothetical protein
VFAFFCWAEKRIPAMKKDSRFFILKFSVGFLLATFFSI